jgi:hypothetical protein
MESLTKDCFLSISFFLRVKDVLALMSTCSTIRRVLKENENLWTVLLQREVNAPKIIDGGGFATYGSYVRSLQQPWRGEATKVWDEQESFPFVDMFDLDEAGRALVQTDEGMLQLWCSKTGQVLQTLYSGLERGKAPVRLAKIFDTHFALICVGEILEPIRLIVVSLLKEQTVIHAEELQASSTIDAVAFDSKSKHFCRVLAEQVPSFLYHVSDQGIRFVRSFQIPPGRPFDLEGESNRYDYPTCADVNADYLVWGSDAGIFRGFDLNCIIPDVRQPTPPPVVLPPGVQAVSTGVESSWGHYFDWWLYSRGSEREAVHSICLGKDHEIFVMTVNISGGGRNDNEATVHRMKILDNCKLRGSFLREISAQDGHGELLPVPGGVLCTTDGNIWALSKPEPGKQEWYKKEEQECPEKLKIFLCGNQLVLFHGLNFNYIRFGGRSAPAVSLKSINYF